jgi:sterol desaturase/sphingolipid hydroxylase (fatty acid hydroxylase superfamily)
VLAVAVGLVSVWGIILGIVMRLIDKRPHEERRVAARNTRKNILSRKSIFWIVGTSAFMFIAVLLIVAGFNWIYPYLPWIEDPVIEPPLITATFSALLFFLTGIVLCMVHYCFPELNIDRRKSKQSPAADS